MKYLIEIRDNPNAISGYCNISPILPSNTKTRRLGYLRMILDLFEKSEYYPVSYFPQKVEQEAEGIEKYLSTYRNDKGLISKSKKKGTFTGTSAKPYLELAENLSLIIEVNKAYILTKQSKVYRVINTQIKESGLTTQFNIDARQLSERENPFELNLFQKLFLLHQILLKDALYFWSLLEMINNQPGIRIENIKNEFRQYILNELYRQLDSSHLSTLNKQKTLHIHQRIRNWQKAEKYLPHIIEPRVNWFLDLDLLDSQAFNQESLKLSKSGIKLFKILTTFYDIFLEKSTIIDFIIQNYYFQIINAIYNLNFRRYTQECSEQLEDYIEESFKYFKTIAPNSISAFQAIYYACYKFLLCTRQKNLPPLFPPQVGGDEHPGRIAVSPCLRGEHKGGKKLSCTEKFLLKDPCIIEFTDVKNFLENKQNTKFTLDWYLKEHDGSLQKRR